MNRRQIESQNRVLDPTRIMGERRGRVTALNGLTSWSITKSLRFALHQIRRVGIALKLVVPVIKHGGGYKNTLARAVTLYRREGFSGLKRALIFFSSSREVRPASGSGIFDRNDYSEWVRRYDTLTDDERVNMRAHQADFENQPLISILMPTYNPKEPWLIAAIESVKNQIYPHWELCIADDASSDPVVRATLERYANEDSRIKVVFRQQNGHISAASNSALELVTGQWVALLDHDDVLPEHALFWVAHSINRHPSARLIYSDECKTDENGKRFDPYFKSDWNQDLFYSHNMFSHLGVYETALVRQVGGFREGFEGSQDYDLALRCIEHVDTNQIVHIPRVLYHWRVHSESTALCANTKPYAMQAGERALNEHFQRLSVDAAAKAIGYGYRASYKLPANLPLVTIVILSKNGLALIRQCIDSILDKTTYPNFEILVVVDGSENAKALRYLEKLTHVSEVRIIPGDGSFNYSRLNNVAVQNAGGEVVVLLNSNIEVVSPEWLSEMVSHAMRPEIGAVGAKLWYSNDTLQHGGMTLGVGGVAAYAHRNISKYHLGYCGRAVLTQNFSAVTAECLVIRKSIYQDLGGLNDFDLPVGYSGVDFCLRVREAGYRNVWTPLAELYHHQPANRGRDQSQEKFACLATEASYMQNHWGKLLQDDPAYSPNLTLIDDDFSYAWPPRTSILPLHSSLVVGCAPPGPLT